MTALTLALSPPNHALSQGATPNSPSSPPPPPSNCVQLLIPVIRCLLYTRMSRTELTGPRKPVPIFSLPQMCPPPYLPRHPNKRPGNILEPLLLPIGFSASIPRAQSPPPFRPSPPLPSVQGPTHLTWPWRPSLISPCPHHRVSPNSAPASRKTAQLPSTPPALSPPGHSLCHAVP